MSFDPIRVAGTYAGLLAAAEVGVGSLLHAFRIPFTGYVLSLNQVLILSKAANDGANAASISSIASILKSLSPMGKKLTPMLAIAMQGLLFQAGMVLGGKTILGRCLGACLSVSWGFIQPIALYYLIFGSVLFEAVFVYIPQNHFFALLGLCAAFKCLLGIGAVMAAPYISPTWWERWIKAKKVEVAQTRPSLFSAALKSFKDLLMFPFLLSLLLTGAYWYALEGPNAQFALYILRSLALGYVVFFALRALPIYRLANWLENKPWKFTRALHEALKSITTNVA